MRAAKIVRSLYPEVIEWGDVRAISEPMIKQLLLKTAKAKLILLIGGAPCQDVSGVNAFRQGPGGSRSRLFRVLVRVRQLLEQVTVFSWVCPSRMWHLWARKQPPST